MELVRLGASLTALDRKGRQPLVLAAADIETLGFLVMRSSYGAWGSKTTAQLILALCSDPGPGKVPLLQQVLSLSGADVNVCDEAGVSALHHCVLRDAADLAAVLLHAGVDLQMRTRQEHFNVLHLVAIAGATRCAALLAKQAVCVELLVQHDDDGLTPLHLVAQRDHTSVLVIWLSQRWADRLRFVRDSKMRMPSACAKEGHIQALLAAFEANPAQPASEQELVQLVLQARARAEEPLDGHSRVAPGEEAKESDRQLSSQPQPPDEVKDAWHEQWRRQVHPSNEELVGEFCDLVKGLAVPRPFPVPRFDLLVQVIRAADVAHRQLQLDLLHTAPQDEETIALVAAQKLPVLSCLVLVPAVDGHMTHCPFWLKESTAAALARAMSCALKANDRVAASAILAVSTNQQLRPFLKLVLLQGVSRLAGQGAADWLAAGPVVAMKFGQGLLEGVAKQPDAEVTLKAACILAYRMPLDTRPDRLQQALTSSNSVQALLCLVKLAALQDNSVDAVVDRMLTKCPSVETHAFAFDGRPMFPISAGEGQRLRKQGKIVDAEMEAAKDVSDAQLRTRLCGLPMRLATCHQEQHDKPKVDEEMACAVALLALAFRRVFRITPYVVQRLVVLALVNEPDIKKEAGDTARGCLAQVATGEGKSLIVALLAALRALQGRNVDVISSTRQLALREHAEFAPFFAFLGISTSVVAADHSGGFDVAVVFGVNTDFEFAQLVQGVTCRAIVQRDGAPRARHDVIVDESDSLLLDKAQNSARISWPAPERHEWVYRPLLQVARGPSDNELDRAHEALAKFRDEPFTDERVIAWLAHARAALCKVRGVDYVLWKGKVVIIDQLTGRRENGCRWSGGLHEFVEVNEGLEPEQESFTVASMGHPAFFAQYERIMCLTGTAGEQVERDGLARMYGIPCFDMCPNKPCLRRKQAMRVFTTQLELDGELVELARRGRAAKRPTLMLFRSINDVETFGHVLRGAGFEDFFTLTDCQYELEDYVVFRTGHAGALTLATNAAGRGTDIRLTPAAVQAGGLSVVVAFFPENFRVECQALGRAARGGQPGDCCIITNLEDPFLQKLGVQIVPDADGAVDSDTLRAVYTAREAHVAEVGRRRELACIRDRAEFDALQLFFNEFARLHARVEAVREPVRQEAWRRRVATIQTEWARLFSAGCDLVAAACFCQHHIAPCLKLLSE
jgi:hypothetical protein